MTVYCSTPATLRLEAVDGSGNVTGTLDLMDQANGYRVESLELAWPAVREVTAALPTRDGSFDTTALFGPRVVTVIGSIMAATVTRQSYVGTLGWWLAPSQRPRLVFAVDPAAPTMRIGLRGSQLASPYTNPTANAFTASWVAPDPVCYAYTGRELVILPSTTAAGRTYNLTFNRAYAPAGPGGYGQAVNYGTYPTWPVFTVYGPCTNPCVYYQTPAAGQIVTLSMSINTGDHVVVDTRASTVLYNGQAGASRYDQLDLVNTVWAPLQPGPTGLRFQTATQGAGCQLVVDWSDAWLD